jgi:hypothetical protein
VVAAQVHRAVLHKRQVLVQAVKEPTEELELLLTLVQMQPGVAVVAPAMQAKPDLMY